MFPPWIRGGKMEKLASVSVPESRLNYYHHLKLGEAILSVLCVEVSKWVPVTVAPTRTPKSSATPAKTPKRKDKTSGKISRYRVFVLVFFFLFWWCSKWWSPSLPPSFFFLLPLSQPPLFLPPSLFAHSGSPIVSLVSQSQTKITDTKVFLKLVFYGKFPDNELSAWELY